MELGISSEFSGLEFERIEQEIRQVLKEHGFGILTEIDVKATMKDKLNLNYRPYKILGACNPPNANKALIAEPEIGLLLPCNVIIYEKADSKIRVSITSPKALFTLIDRDDVEPLANEIENLLKSALNKISSNLVN
ncbi:MAG: DUF302 domain-containing protein [Candidatus Kariarchaeaceae archaeon]|jgi:uncharacterized protein (DUF302 family)